MYISTHAPLAGRDWRSARFSVSQEHFNPRAPCGARLDKMKTDAGALSISTHAPRAGRDGATLVQGMSMGVFQPTRPLRGATASRAICPSWS